MRKITVEKTKLIETLRANREVHVKDFELAYWAFSERVRENLEERLKSLKNGRKATREDLWINLEIPQDHTEDYDRVIEMLTWDLGDEVELQQDEFRQYVQNDWRWRAEFEASNMTYTGSASPSSMKR